MTERDGIEVSSFFNLHSKHVVSMHNWRLIEQNYVFILYRQAKLKNKAKSVFCVSYATEVLLKIVQYRYVLEVSVFIKVVDDNLNVIENLKSPKKSFLYVKL